MREIGTVKFVQIQRSRMKTGEGPNRVYRPDPLLVVDQILLTAEGISGLDVNGNEIVDVHNSRHPESRNRVHNTVSIGFTQHYNAMLERFGAHMYEGVAGENIIVDASEDITPETFSGKMFIEHQTDGNLIELVNVIAATPCAEFSKFAADRDLSATELKETLQFLDKGRRGFYATVVEKDCQCLVAAGDRLFIE